MNANTLIHPSLAAYATRMADLDALMKGTVRRSAIVTNFEPKQASNSAGLDGRIWLHVIPSTGLVQKTSAPYARDAESVSPAELTQLRNQAVCVGAIANYSQGDKGPNMNSGTDFAATQLFAIDEACFDFVIGLTPVRHTQVWLCLAVPLM